MRKREMPGERIEHDRVDGPVKRNESDILHS
jgi:hypothetical protein